MGELQAGIESVLAVFSWLYTLFQLGEAAFNNQALGHKVNHFAW